MKSQKKHKPEEIIEVDRPKKPEEGTVTTQSTPGGDPITPDPSNPPKPKP